MTPWMVLVVLTAGINLAIFVFIRGRWGRIVLALALASVAGTIVGNAAGEVMRIHLVRIGDFNFLAASVFAQVAMLATLLLAVAVEARATEEAE